MDVASENDMRRLNCKTVRTILADGPIFQVKAHCLRNWATSTAHAALLHRAPTPSTRRAPIAVQPHRPGEILALTSAGRRQTPSVQARTLSSCLPSAATGLDWRKIDSGHAAVGVVTCWDSASARMGGASTSLAGKTIRRGDMEDKVRLSAPLRHNRGFESKWFALQILVRACQRVVF